MKVHDETKVPEFLVMLDELFNTHLEIGIFGEDDSEIVMIASVHEFGVEIKVTDKMRGYLHSIGIHLGPNTKTVKIPERSYLRAGYDKEKENIIRQSEKLLEKVLTLELPVSIFFETLGELIVGMIQKYLTELKNPPLHPATIKNKGSSNPLIDAGHLRESITYKVVKD
ncbi:hypothetical protein [Sporanaerobacter acetigenes]|uniref:hypothetical protein n=1 Tax=Sporanaerobacter acetigenes TaxID=165813 RepID=UPI001044EA56|nr:hypothetical protein [Sporanaerobacter acetigenes]